VKRQQQSSTLLLGGAALCYAMEAVSVAMVERLRRFFGASQTACVYGPRGQRLASAVGAGRGDVSLHAVLDWETLVARRARERVDLHWASALRSVALSAGW